MRFRKPAAQLVRRLKEAFKAPLLFDLDTHGLTEQLTEPLVSGEEHSWRLVLGDSEIHIPALQSERGCSDSGIEKHAFTLADAACLWNCQANGLAEEKIITTATFLANLSCGSAAE